MSGDTAYQIPPVFAVCRGGVVDYLTDTMLCKALFGLALLTGLAIGVWVIPRK